MKKVIFAFCALLLIGATVFARDIKVAIKDIPQKESFVALVNAVLEATGNTAVIQIVPPPRADYMLSQKEVELQYPIVVTPDPAKQKALGYDYASITLYKTAWVLYTNKDKPIDVKSLRNGNPKNYVIEIDPSRSDDYNFKGSPSSNLEASITKVSKGLIDGFIIYQSGGDQILKKSGYKNIKRELWSELDNTFSLQKGARGGEIDKMLSDGVAKMKANGDFNKLVGSMVVSAKYDDWQP